MKKARDIQYSAVSGPVSVLVSVWTLVEIRQGGSRGSFFVPGLNGEEMYSARSRQLTHPAGQGA